MKKSCLFVVLMLASHMGFGGDSLQTMSGVYRVPAGRREGHIIWIVDGATVRRDVYREFLYGGNAQRYRFIPVGEIWVDNAVGAEEFGYTVAHELHERALMARRGMTYADAHDSALVVEHAMRRADRKAARQHEAMLPKVSPTDCDGVKEIDDLPDSIRLQNVYRVDLGHREGIAIWVVDGAVVRRDIYADFGLSGNDRAYHFIPSGEIWIDGQVSCEEMEFSIITELTERACLLRGQSYDDAYEHGVSASANIRRRAAEAAELHKPLVVPEQPDRDVGTGDERDVR